MTKCSSVPSVARNPRRSSPIKVFRRASAVALVLLLAAAPIAAAQSIGWAKQQGGTPAVEISVEEARAIATDSLGNIYTTGSFRDQATFGAGESNETVLRIPEGFLPNTQGIFVAKYGPDGQFIWARGARGNGIHQDWTFALPSMAPGTVT